MASVQDLINKAQTDTNNLTNSYYGSQEYKNAQALQNSTIQDIAKKYGFDFSQAYADKQAAAQAQPQIDQYNNEARQNDSLNKTNLQSIMDNYNNAASSLDKGYFQQYLKSNQSSVNRGLNAGLAAAQNTQLALGKQQQLAGIWRNRQTSTQQEDMRYADEAAKVHDALATVAQQRGANAQKMYQDLLAQGYDILNSDRSSANQLSQNAWNQTQDKIGNMMDISKLNISNLQDQIAAAQAAAKAAADRKAAADKKAAATAAMVQASPVQAAVQSYNAAKAASANTGMDYYAQAMKSIFQPAPLAKPAYTPPKVAQNATLSPWAQMKIIGAL